jgi:lactoylglutathione lyase
MSPIDPTKSPKVQTPALNHIGLWVDDLPKAVESLSRQGIQFTPGGVRKGASGYDVVFIHPRSATGVLLELVQAPPEILQHYSPTA